VQQFQLDRWALEGNGSPDIVRRNLASVLAQFTLEDPPSSPLVIWARTPHGQRGDAASRPMAAHQTALLLEWLNLVAGIEPLGDVPSGASDLGSASGALELAPEGGPLLVGSVATGPDSVQSAPMRFAPRDAFDPEIFNRRHAPQAEAAETVDGAEDFAGQAIGEPVDSATITE
jgi:hypothetical protein